MSNNKRNQLKKNTRGPRRPKQQRNVAFKIERMEHPPQVNGYEITHKTRLRFTVTAAASVTITYQNILDALLVATSAIAGFDLFDLVKIRSVEVWSQAALGTPSTITVTYATATGDRSIHTDTSLGVKPAYILAIPSKNSLASFFQASAAGQAFVVVCPAGSILDLSCTYRVSNAAAVAAQNALVGATVGEFYYRGLDGLATAGTNFPPIAGVAAI